MLHTIFRTITDLCQLHLAGHIQLNQLALTSHAPLNQFASADLSRLDQFASAGLGRLDQLSPEDSAELQNTMDSFKEAMAPIKELFYETKDFFTWPRIVAFTGFVVAEIYCIKFMKIIARRPTKLDKKIEKAIELGHVVKAHVLEWRKGDRDHDPDDHHNSWHVPRYYAIVTYTVNGRNYKRQRGFDRVPPQELNMYYLDNPGRAFHDEQYTPEPLKGFFFLFLVFLPLLFGAFVLWILGDIPE